MYMIRGFNSSSNQLEQESRRKGRTLFLLLWAALQESEFPSQLDENNLLLKKACPYLDEKESGFLRHLSQEE